MSNPLLQIWEQTLQLWKKLNTRQKVVIGGSFIGLFLILLYFTQMATKPDFVPLWNRLDAQDAGAIVTKLKDLKATYQLADGGATILVPSKDADQLRLELANQGLPRQGMPGFESLDTVRFGETDADKQMRFLIALQGELVRTLRLVPGVDDVRVNITPAQESLFAQQEKTAQASVMLVLQPGATLQQAQVQGILHLISKSVQSLPPENITIVDQYGDLLSEGLASGKDATGAQLSATQVDVKRNMETDIQKKVQTMLDKVLGGGNAVARASVELDFDQVNKETLHYIQDKSVPVSQQVTEETARNTGGAQGNPGSDSNVPVAQTQTTSNNTESTKSDTTTNWNTGQEKTSTVSAPGKIKRMTVSVVVNNQKIQLDDTQRNNLRKTIADAVSADENRGDSVTVMDFGFGRSAMEDDFQKAQAAEQSQARWMLYGEIALGLILVAIAFIVVNRLRQVKRGVGDEMTAAFMKAPAAPPTPPVELSPAELEKLKMREQIEELAKKNPEGVAQLLKTWLAEEAR